MFGLGNRKWLRKNLPQFKDLADFIIFYTLDYVFVAFSPRSFMKYLSALQAIWFRVQLPMYQIAQDHCLYEGFESELALACVSLTLTHFFSLNLFWLIFARFNLHWALSNRLSYREEIREKTFSEFFTTPLRAQPDWVRAVSLSPFMCGRKTQQWHKH